MAKFIQNYNFEELEALVNFFQRSQQKGFLPIIELQRDTIDDSNKLFKNPFVLKDVLINGINIKDQIQKANKDRFYKILENLHKECKEEGFEVFNEKARTNARQILDFLCENFPECDFDVYPTEDREIDIYYNPEKGRGILITCDSGSGIAYFKTLEEKDSRYRCQNINDFPFDQLYKEFESLKWPEVKVSAYSDLTSSLKTRKLEYLNNEYKIA